MWRGLSCVKVAGRRRKSPQKKKKRAQRPTDHRMHLNWFIKAPRPPPHPPPPPSGPGSSSPPPRNSLLSAPAGHRVRLPSPRARLPGRVAIASSCSRSTRNPHRPPATVGRPCGEPQTQSGRTLVATRVAHPLCRLRARTSATITRDAEMTFYLSTPTPSVVRTTPAWQREREREKG